LCRQLPVFGRLAYPVRAEATKHVLPGCKSLGCPAARCAAVGTTWETSKLGGLNIKKCLQPRKHPPARSRIRGMKREADPDLSGGRPMTRRKKQVYALRGTAVVGDQASEERFAEITSGSRSGKLGRGGTDGELAKPLIVIQRVQIPPDQSRADRSVVSLAIHRATGGCRSVGNKEARP
jgi:hypothetical protein